VSAGPAIPHAIALRVAESVVDFLGEGCRQIAIAGSLRRQKPEVHDIEIVAEPRIVMRAGDELFPVEHETDLLEERIAEALNRGTFEPRQVENKRTDGSIDVQTKLGPKFKALVVAGIPLDLFVVRPPATWGVVFALRTGPGDWNTKLVTDCQAIGRRVSGGQVEAWRGATSSWEVVPTPTEEDFFRALGQPWLEPRDRRVERVAIRRPVGAAV
jgi:DNA polymerase/3'-5' exonuclease PolX